MIILAGDRVLPRSYVEFSLRVACLLPGLQRHVVIIHSALSWTLIIVSPCFLALDYSVIGFCISVLTRLFSGGAAPLKYQYFTADISTFVLYLVWFGGQ